MVMRSEGATAVAGGLRSSNGCLSHSPVSGFIRPRSIASRAPTRNEGNLAILAACASASAKRVDIFAVASAAAIMSMNSATTGSESREVENA